MQVDLDKLNVMHNQAENKFEVSIDGHLCKLDYMQDANNFVIEHVGVDPAFRGQGVAGKIMETALEYARQNSLRVIPMCSYAAHYIRKNPQYLELTKPAGNE
jgi:predicted GNAT family acetyltransferase